MGKDRATVANTLRLLKLPAEVQGDVAAGAITMGHARALLALPGDNSQLHLAPRGQDARLVGARDRSAGQARAGRRRADGHASPRTVTPQAAADVHTRAAEDKLKLLLGTRVRIKRKAKGGRIEIDFGNENELIRIFEALTEK